MDGFDFRSLGLNEFLAFWRHLGTRSSLLRCLLSLSWREIGERREWACKGRDGGESGEERLEVGELAEPCSSSLPEGRGEAGREPQIQTPQRPAPRRPKCSLPASGRCQGLRARGCGDQPCVAVACGSLGPLLAVRPHFLVVLREAFSPPRQPRASRCLVKHNSSAAQGPGSPTPKCRLFRVLGSPGRIPYSK